MSQEMRMHIIHAGIGRSLGEALVEAVAGHWTTETGDKDIPRSYRLRSPQLAKPAHYPPADRLDAVIRPFTAPDLHAAGVEVDQAPFEPDQLANSVTMSVSHQDHAAVPITIRSAYQTLYLVFGQILALRLSIQISAWCGFCSHHIRRGFAHRELAASIQFSAEWI